MGMAGRWGRENVGGNGQPGSKIRPIIGHSTAVHVRGPASGACGRGPCLRPSRRRTRVEGTLGGSLAVGGGGGGAGGRLWWAVWAPVPPAICSDPAVSATVGDVSGRRVPSPTSLCRPCRAVPSAHRSTRSARVAGKPTERKSQALFIHSTI
jgi:hypothetical protein